MQAMESIHSEFKLHYKSVLLSNLYGPGDNFNLESSHLIPAVIRKVFEAKIQGQRAVTIMGTGRARREFTFVDDVSEWIFQNLSNIQKFPSRLNLGYGKDFSVDEYYDFAASVIGYEGDFIHDTYAPEGMFQKLMDSSDARENFGWQPRVDPKKGISLTFKHWSERGLENEI